MNEADTRPSLDSDPSNINPIVPEPASSEITLEQLEEAQIATVLAEREAAEAEREADEALALGEITPEDLAKAAAESQAAAQAADIAEGELGMAMAITPELVQPTDLNPAVNTNTGINNPQQPHLPPVVAPVSVTNVTQNTINTSQTLPSPTPSASGPQVSAKPTTSPETPHRANANKPPRPTTLPEVPSKKPANGAGEVTVVTDPAALELQRETTKQLAQLSEMIKNLEERLAKQAEAEKIAQEQEMIESGQMTPLEMDERAERLAKTAQKELEKKWWGLSPEYTLFRLKGLVQTLQINPIAGLIIASKFL